MKTADFYNIPIGDVRTLVPKCLIKKNMQLYLSLGLNLKKCMEF